MSGSTGGTRAGSETGTPVPGRSSWRSRSCGLVPTSPSGCWSGCGAFGCEQRSVARFGFAPLVPGTGDVGPVPAPAFGSGDRARIETLGVGDGGAVVAEDLGDADLIQRDVGRSERGVAVIGVSAEEPRRGGGLVDEVVGLSGVAVDGGGVGGDLQQGPVNRCPGAIWSAASMRRVRARPDRPLRRITVATLRRASARVRASLRGERVQDRLAAVGGRLRQVHPLLPRKRLPLRPSPPRGAGTRAVPAPRRCRCRYGDASPGHLRRRRLTWPVTDYTDCWDHYAAGVTEGTP
jgi:hypothetical protein